VSRQYFHLTSGEITLSMLPALVQGIFTTSFCCI